jgi:hypothetical protein
MCKCSKPYVRDWYAPKDRLPRYREQIQATADKEQYVVRVRDHHDGNKIIARIRPRYRFIEDIATRNKRAGYNWFDPSNMRMFGTRVQSAIYRDNKGGAYFVTSERDRYGNAWNGRRLYSVRYASKDGDVHTVGEMGAYETGRAAHKAAQEALAEGRTR